MRTARIRAESSAYYHLRRADIIGELDKRLDSRTWPADGIVAGSSMKLRGREALWCPK